MLECRFVSDADPTSTLSHFSFAADISGGRLHMLLVRPPPDDGGDPTVQSYSAVRAGVSVHHDIDTSGSGGPDAELDLATVGPGDTVRLDEWRFGGTEDFHSVLLRCPSHA